MWNVYITNSYGALDVNLLLNNLMLASLRCISLQVLIIPFPSWFIHENRQNCSFFFSLIHYLGTISRIPNWLITYGQVYTAFPLWPPQVCVSHRDASNGYLYMVCGVWLILTQSLVSVWGFQLGLDLQGQRKHDIGLYNVVSCFSSFVYILVQQYRILEIDEDGCGSMAVGSSSPNV